MSFDESTRQMLLTFIFDLAAQDIRKFRHMELDDLAHEIGLNAFEQLSRQPSAREKVQASLLNGSDEWKRVAHMCVIHARAEKVKHTLTARSRTSDTPIEEFQLQSPDRVLPAMVSDLQDCVSKLDPERQTVLQLRFNAGLTFQEIADQLNWSKTRVYGCYATAIMHLERSLKERE